MNTPKQEELYAAIVEYGEKYNKNLLFSDKIYDLSWLKNTIKTQFDKNHSAEYKATISTADYQKIMKLIEEVSNELYK